MGSNTNVSAGRCLCGDVRFETDAPLDAVVHCHCGQCRRQTGTHVAATRVPSASLSVAGMEHVTWFRSSDEAERGFCSRCGSALFWRRIGGASTSVFAGAMDDQNVLHATAHIYVADKPDWYTIDDGLPQYAESDR